MLRALRRTSLVLIVAASGACASLDAVSVNTCGNLEVEDGEQCDGPPADGSGFSCGDSGLGACRYQCGAAVVGADGAASVSVCPSGYACSLNDHICRAESLEPDGMTLSYSTLPIGLAATAQALAFGDFNGDGVGDLFVVNDNLKELYLGSSTGFTKTFSSQVDVRGDVLPVSLGPNPYDAANPDNPSGHPLSTSLYSPASGQPTPDTTTDLLFLSEAGPAVLTGNSDGTPTPVAYPALAVPGNLRFVGFAQAYYPNGIDTDALPPPVPFILVPAMQIPVCGDGLNLARPAIDSDYTNPPDNPNVKDGLVVVGCIPQVTDFSQLTHIEARLLGGATDAACPTFLFGTTLGAYTYDPCNPPDSGSSADGPTLATDSTVDVPSLSVGAPEAGPFPFDVDRDGQLDLLTALSGGQFVVSTFDASTSTYTPAGYDVFVNDSGGHPGVALSKPLAVGDINGDGYPDWVTPDGVYLSLPCKCFGMDVEMGDGCAVIGDPTCTTHERVAEVFEVSDATAILGVPADSAISSAVVGDMTGDGRPDVTITLTSGGHDLSVVVVLQFAGTEDGAPFIDVHSVAVPLPVSGLVTGDFNGDGLADVGFAETDPNSGTNTVSVVFGDPSASFAAVDMGHVSGIVELQPTDSRGYDGFLNGFQDLGVMGVTPTTQQPLYASTASILAGAEGHVLLAALGLVKAKGNGKSLYRAQSIAVAAGFFGGDQRSLVMIGGQLQSDGSPMMNAVVELWSAPLTGDAVLAGELGRDEIDTGADFPTDYDSTNPPTAVMATGTFSGQPNDSAVALVSYPSGDGRATSLYRIDYTPGTPPSITKLADVSASATPLTMPNAAPRIAVAQLVDPADGGPDVVVLTTDGALSRFVVPIAGGAATPQPIAVDVRDFALLPRAGEDAEFDLLYTSITADAGVDSTSPGATVDVARQPDFTPSTLLTIDNLTGAIAAGDMNGDRLPDIAVATTEGVKVYLMNAP
jgi:hypothetical protein